MDCSTICVHKRILDASDHFYLQLGRQLILDDKKKLLVHVFAHYFVSLFHHLLNAHVSVYTKLLPFHATHTTALREEIIYSFRRQHTLNGLRQIKCFVA